MPAIFDQDVTLNLAKIDERIRREVLDGLYFKDLIGFSVPDDEQFDNGQKEFTPSGNIIEAFEGMKEASRDNMIITMDTELVGEPIYGDGDASGTGESWDFNHLRVHINETTKTVNVKSGTMSDIRAMQYKVRERARPKLARYFQRLENSHIVQAIYNGASKGITEGLNAADNGIGLTGRYASNMVTLKGTGASCAVADVGTVNRTKSAGQLTSAVQAGDLTPIEVGHIELMALECEDKKINKAIRYKGEEYWLWALSDKDYYYLRQDSDWKTAELAWIKGRGSYDNPIFNRAVNVYNGFIFHRAKLEIRSWNTDTGDFAGTNGWRGRPTYATGEGNNVSYILGASAIGHAIANNYHIEEESSNFKRVMEVAGMITNGWERVDFVPASYEATFFAKGNANETFLGVSSSDVINTSMLQVMSSIAI